MTGVPGSLASSSTAESVSELTVLARADLRGDTAVVFGWGEAWADTETDTTLGEREGFSSDIDLQGNKVRLNKIQKATVVLCYLQSEFEPDRDLDLE